MLSTAVCLNFCGTHRSTPAAFFPLSEAYTAKINLAAQSAGRSSRTSCSISETIRARGRRKASIRGLIPVPSMQSRTGNLADLASSLTGAVSGPNLAQQLSQRLWLQREGKRTVLQPGLHIRRAMRFSKRSDPSQCMGRTFQAFAAIHSYAERRTDDIFRLPPKTKSLRDDKGSYRSDYNSDRFGLLTGYYYFDDYNLTNPYPTGQGGANVPGFGALNLGRSQLLSAWDIQNRLAQQR